MADNQDRSQQPARQVQREGQHTSQPPAQRTSHLDQGGQSALFPHTTYLHETAAAAKRTTTGKQRPNVSVPAPNPRMTDTGTGPAYSAGAGSGFSAAVNSGFGTAPSVPFSTLQPPTARVEPPMAEVRKFPEFKPSYAAPLPGFETHAFNPDVPSVPVYAETVPVDLRGSTGPDLGFRSSGSRPKASAAASGSNGEARSSLEAADQPPSLFGPSAKPPHTFTSNSLPEKAPEIATPAKSRLGDSIGSTFFRTPNKMVSGMVGGYFSSPEKEGQVQNHEPPPSFSEMMHSFDLNAILRGAQLTFVGAYRAIQNPRLFNTQHYRHAALAVLAGLALRLIVSFPIILVRIGIWVAGLFFDLHETMWDDNLIDALEFIEHSVLQLPFFLMSIMRHITPTLDQMFMESLAWVDQTYITKHKDEDPSIIRRLYHDNLESYPLRNRSHSLPDSSTSLSASTSSTAPPVADHISSKKKYLAKIWEFVARSLRKGAISLGVYFCTFIPLLGPFVLPLVSFLTLRDAIGRAPASAIFAIGLALPKRYLIVFLQTYFASRSLMRQLLHPYFSRVPFNKVQKATWFKDRAGVLFGFSLAFYLLIKIPLFGVLVYGIAEASAAYLLTKITDAPPPYPYNPSSSLFGSSKNQNSHADAILSEYIEANLKWTNRNKFLSLPVSRLDDVGHQHSLRSSVGTGNPLFGPSTTATGAATTTGFSTDLPFSGPRASYNSPPEEPSSSSQDNFNPAESTQSANHLPPYGEAGYSRWNSQQAGVPGGYLNTSQSAASYATQRDSLYGERSVSSRTGGDDNDPRNLNRSQISDFMPGQSISHASNMGGSRKYA